MFSLHSSLHHKHATILLRSFHPALGYLNVCIVGYKSFQTWTKILEPDFHQTNVGYFLAINSNQMLLRKFFFINPIRNS
jgi:hypothetical protein